MDRVVAHSAAGLALDRAPANANNSSIPRRTSRRDLCPHDLAGALGLFFRDDLRAVIAGLPQPDRKPNRRLDLDRHFVFSDSERLG